MKIFRADLHIHSVLSPCGDLSMSPVNIINQALEKNIDIIGLTDHNSTRQCEIVTKIGNSKGLSVLCGAEITTREEAHSLAFFETTEKLTEFQSWIDQLLPDIKNDEKKFGYQVIVDQDDNIIGEEEKLLLSALPISIDQLSQKVHELNGLFIPAHVDKAKFSLTSQLGFVPFDLDADALELSKHITATKFKATASYLEKYCYIQSSDAHQIDQLGTTYSIFIMEEPTFEEIRLALAGKEGRRVIPMSDFTGKYPQEVML